MNIRRKQSDGPLMSSAIKKSTGSSLLQKKNDLLRGLHTMSYLSRLCLPFETHKPVRVMMRTTSFPFQPDKILAVKTEPRRSDGTSFVGQLSILAILQKEYPGLPVRACYQSQISRFVLPCDPDDAIPVRRPDNLTR